MAAPRASEARISAMTSARFSASNAAEAIRLPLRDDERDAIDSAYVTELLEHLLCLQHDCPFYSCNMGALP
jgi:hypothetical protein